MFHVILLAYFVSVVSLGLLGIVVPVQIRMMTRSIWQVRLSVTLIDGVIFVGLMVSGVLADRYRRKKVILLACGICDISFIGLCLSTLLPRSSLLAIYLSSLWGGFFASLSTTALLAATPTLVGYEGLMQAGAITMLIVRLGLVISSVIGGLLLATGGVVQDYGLAVTDMFITLLPLSNLPALPPPPQPREYPLGSLLAGFHFLLANPLVGGIVLLGGLLTMVGAVWVLYPTLADNWQMSTARISFSYAVIPLDTATDALTSGRLTHSARPGLLILLSTLGSFLAVSLSGLMSIWILDVVCLTLSG